VSPNITYEDRKHEAFPYSKLALHDEGTFVPETAQAEHVTLSCWESK
jgi:hypothetical protein